MIVIKGKVKKIKELVSVGISNNGAKEFKKQFVDGAMLDYYRQSRSVAWALKLRDYVADESRR